MILIGNVDPAATLILRAMLVAAGLLYCDRSASGADAGALLAQACLGCHAPGGSRVGAIPAIAGRPAEELRDLMRAFRADERPGTIMNRIARGYTDAEIAAIADHVARQD